MLTKAKAMLLLRVPRPSVIAYGGNAVSGTDAASYSFVSIPVSHAPGAHRALYAWIFSSTPGTVTENAEPSSCSIGGVTAALVTRFARAATNSACVALYAAPVPLGAAATVDVSFPASQRRCGCILASAINQRIFPALFGILTASGTDDISGHVFAPRAGFVGVHGQDNFAAETFMFSGAGAVEVADVTVESGTRIGAATLAVDGTLSIASNNDAGMDAIWMGW